MSASNFWRLLARCGRVTATGDDLDAKADVSRFLDAIGYDTVDAGLLAEGWRWQPGTPAHVVYAGATIQVAEPANAEKVRNALAAATR